MRVLATTRALHRARWNMIGERRESGAGLDDGGGRGRERGERRGSGGPSTRCPTLLYALRGEMQRPSGEHGTAADVDSRRPAQHGCLIWTMGGKNCGGLLTSLARDPRDRRVHTRTVLATQARV